MNILDVLDYLDGRGIIVVDDDDIADALRDLNLDTAAKVVL